MKESELIRQEISDQKIIALSSSILCVLAAGMFWVVTVSDLHSLVKYFLQLLLLFACPGLGSVAFMTLSSLLGKRRILWRQLNIERLEEDLK